MMKKVSRGRPRISRAREMNPPGYYTRDQARDLLQLTEREVRKLVTHGVLRADRMNNAGWALYTEAQLETLANRKKDGSLFNFDPDALVTKPPENGPLAYTAEEGVRVFRLIEEGKALHVIAIETGYHPRMIDQIRYDYDILAGSMLVPKAILDQMNAVKHLQGAFPLRSPTDLLEVLLLASASRACASCSKHTAAPDCPACARAKVIDELRAEASARHRAAATAQAQEKPKAEPRQSRSQQTDAEPVRKTGTDDVQAAVSSQ